MCGVYDEGGDLVFEHSSNEHTSDALISILSQVSKTHDIHRIIYANGPGSYMGLKVSYVTLKSYCVVKNCDFYAVSGFELNGGGSVRATKTMSFIKEYINKDSSKEHLSQIFSDGDGEYIVRLASIEASEFKLPLNLNTLQTSADTVPMYFTQAV
ncbi:glycoprotease [Campylobacter sp. 19-13652]|uniref:glycoprotease n=1 Tax=Campylobacter sp. 19-13652 TaxID=2840180 RepID=UPI001C7405B1|nr:glycoprotease [Campylobacter sp. 19-13652]BCX79872.1 glycoprotease [Campylobacter sp. 19-13652]